ncbi:hypothetical protein ASPCAL06996 [Aspergillus calidoustus]|uniref:Uncharacterized protein n=1 Tax=Aspergillus calidoustus TaxID=454130 RepID=A0A0U5C9V8_ASPCI|nr:hypothetical protein ASPCAL06996 [Aspergillus calidoustus]
MRAPIVLLAIWAVLLATFSMAANEPKSISHRNVADKANMIVTGCPWSVRDLHDVVSGIRQVVGDWRVVVKEDKNIC